MKHTLAIFLLMIFISLACTGQITSAELKADGLVCSLCSKSIEKSLNNLTFIVKLDVDLQNTTYILTFKEGIKLDLEEISKSVEKAGFSVGYLNVVYKNNANTIVTNGCIIDDYFAFQLVEGKSVPSKTILHLKIIGEGFLSKQDYKPWKKKLPAPCLNDKKVYYVAVL